MIDGEVRVWSEGDVIHWERRPFLQIPSVSERVRLPSMDTEVVGLSHAWDAWTEEPLVVVDVRPVEVESLEGLESAFAPESPEASEFVAALSVGTGEYPRRVRPPVAIVVHTTGSGPGKRWHREKNHPRKKQPTPFGTAVHRIYSRIMRFGPHYVVGQAGECAQMCPEGTVAWHVASRGSWRYLRGSWAKPEYDWWADRWPELSSPSELAGDALWTGGSCNANSIGIEVVPDADNPRAAWSEACWTKLNALLRDLATRHEIPLTPAHVLTHSDCHPIDRTSNGRPWDPGPTQWSGPEIIERLQGE